MSQKILFAVKSRPSKENAGRTDVVNTIFEKDGKTVTSSTVIGKLRKVRGAEGYTAFVLDTTATGGRVELEGTFKTRSQAGHAVQRAYFVEDRAAKDAKRAAAVKAIADKKAAKIAAKAAAVTDTATA